MKFFRGIIVAGAACALAGNLALAQEEGEDGLDVTITLLPEHVELPDAVTRELELPRDDVGDFRASEQGVENSAAGLERANEAREQGRNNGLETAEENRENMGRESRPSLEDLPDQVPDLPDVPNPPDLPDPPGGADLPGGPDLPDTPAGPPGPPGG